MGSWARQLGAGPLAENSCFNSSCFQQDVEAAGPQISFGVNAGDGL